MTPTSSAQCVVHCAPLPPQCPLRKQGLVQTTLRVDPATDGIMDCMLPIFGWDRHGRIRFFFLHGLLGGNGNCLRCCTFGLFEGVWYPASPLIGSF